MKTFLAAIAILCYIKSSTQTIAFEWVKRLDRNYAISGSEPYSVGNDSLKNVYIAGNFRTTLDVDPGPGVTNISSNYSSIYIIKLDQFGNFIWGKQFVGQEVILTSMHVDLAGNIYSSGYFYGTVDFDPGGSVYNLTTPPTYNYFSANIFISKIDANGNFKWAKGIGAQGPDVAHSITADRFGNVYTTGYLSSVVDFDPGPGVYNVNITGTTNPYITKYDSAGNFRYAKIFETNHSGGGEFIRTDEDGNVYSTGYFTGTADFDPDSAQFNIVGDFWNNNLYLAKLDSAGTFMWAIKDLNGYQIAVDGSKNTYVFGGHAAGGGALCKYDNIGNLLWSKVMGGGPYFDDQNTNIDVDSFDNIYVTGVFGGTKDFDPGSTVYNLTAFSPAITDMDVYIAKYTSNGSFVWAKSFGNYADDFSTGISVDQSGNVYTTGVFNGLVDFDPDAAVYTPFVYSGVYIHKMSPCVNRSYSTLNIAACNSYSLNGIIYDSTGIYKQVISNSIGCDSIITLNLSIHGSSSSINVTACESYSWNGHLLFTSGLYTDTLLAASGCDSILKLNLTIKKSSHSNVSASICNGYTYEGYSLPGIYIDTFVGANGCDSIRTLHLQVDPIRTTTLRSTICEGYTFLGYSINGTFKDTFHTTTGCDSIRTLFLTVKPRAFTQLSQTICSGQAYLGYTETGFYTDTLISSTGCDSIRRLNLFVRPLSIANVTKTICKGEAYLNHTTSGIYNDTVRNNTGCDSVIISTLAVLDKPKLHLPNDTVFCEGTSLVLDAGSYSLIKWQDGSTSQKYLVTQKGIYTIEVSNQCGTVVAQTIVRDSICNITIPNAFSPNGDGVNDNWKISGLEGLSFSLKVFTRLGMPVYESLRYTKPWDGMWNGKPLSTGVYYYVLTISGSNQILSGWVNILR